MKVNLKNNIWIEGFNDENIVEWNSRGYYKKYLDKTKPLIYWGLTSEITEEIAKSSVELLSIFSSQYRKYDGEYSDYVETPIESLQTACKEKYCLIYKE